MGSKPVKTARTGKCELELLAQCANPAAILLTPDRTAEGLIRKGLLRRDGNGMGACITASGLRHLASAIDAGKLEDGFERARQHRERAN